MGGIEVKQVGRPALGDDKRKPRSVKMSDAEWEEIQKRAAKLGITASEYIRLRTLVAGV